MKTLKIALPVPLRRYFDYLAPENFDPNTPIGVRVRVPFQKRELVGLYMGVNESSQMATDKLKPILEILDTQSIFQKDLLELCLWAADYYQHPVGDVLCSAMPAALRHGKVAEIKKFKNKLIPTETTQAEKLNPAQQAAVEKIIAEKGFQIYLLDGVTGSGKTEVYLQVMSELLKMDKQILLLVPEIGLTPQTIQRFRERFNVLAVALHSNLTDKQRLEVWLLAKTGQAKIIIGTRSAVFSPFENLGLIIVDEEHDLSFKQQDSFRYHGRDLAIKRAQLNDIPIILGSATPALESLHNAKRNRYHYLQLPERAGNATQPEFSIIDIRNKQLLEGISPSLLTEIQNHLTTGNQVLLFLNRRGFAPILMCHSCGWIAKCNRCDANMTYHQHSKRLLCHHCDKQKWIANHCEKCHSKELMPIGLGTERIEIMLQQHFPQYAIARIDRDTTKRKGQFEDLLDKVQSGEYKILIGTQMLAKGHHFKDVTLVAIIDADAGLFSNDFRGTERMGQLILQVAGRSGRAEKCGKVVIQTRHPENPLLQQLLSHSYKHFADSILQERQQVELPPFSYQALFRAEAHNEKFAFEFLQMIKEIKIISKEINLLGPIPAIMPKRAGRFRAQLLLQSNKRQVLQNHLQKLIPEVEQIKIKHKVRWSLDIDPLEMF